MLNTRTPPFGAFAQIELSHPPGAAADEYGMYNCLLESSKATECALLPVISELTTLCVAASMMNSIGVQLAFVPPHDAPLESPLCVHRLAA